MLDLGTLRIGVTVDDKDAKSKLKGITTAAAGVGAAAVGLGVASVKAFGDFETSINKVATIADLTVKPIEDIQSEVLALSTSMGIAGEEINEAMYQAISATGDTANALTYVESAAKLAKGGFTDTASAMDAVTKTMNAYGQSGEEAFTKISDLLIQTQNQGITTVNELSGALYNVVPTAAALGVSFEDVSASMATMTAQGTPTSVATTQLRSAMNELSKSGTDASDAFKKVAGEGFAEFMAGGGNMSEAMKIMEEAARQNGVSLTDMFSSVEAGAAALALTGSGAEKYNESLQAMQESAGATDAAYETMAQGINASFGKMVNAMKNVMIELGDKLAPLFTSFAEWIEAHMPQIQAVIETTFDVIGGVIDLCVGWVEKLITWFDDLLKNNIETGEGLKVVWTEAKSMFDTCYKEIKELVDAFIGWCTRVWDKYGEQIKTITQSTWDIITTIFNGAIAILKPLIDGFTAFFEGDMEGLKESSIRLMDTMWTGIKDLFNSGVEWIKNLVPMLFQAGCDLVQGLWDGWKSVWQGMQDWVKGKCSDLLSSITDFFQIKSPSRVMKGIGSNLGEGMAIGLKNSMNLVEDEASKMMDVINDNFGVGINGEITANNQPTFNVSVDNTSVEGMLSKLNMQLSQLNQKLDRLPSSFRQEERLGIVRG